VALEEAQVMAVMVDRLVQVVRVGDVVHLAYLIIYLTLSMLIIPEVQALEEELDQVMEEDTILFLLVDVLFKIQWEVVGVPVRVMQVFPELALQETVQAKALVETQEEDLALMVLAMMHLQMLVGPGEAGVQL
jgi:hypothetical protein